MIGVLECGLRFKLVAFFLFIFYFWLKFYCCSYGRLWYYCEFLVFMFGESFNWVFEIIFFFREGWRKDY